MYLITGGGTGIGAALAHELALAGKSVCVVGRHEETLKKVCEDHSMIKYHVLDLLSKESIECFLNAFAKTSWQGVIHNAGRIDPIESLETMRPNDFEKVIQLNVLAPMSLTYHLLHNLRGGRVLMLGSGAAHFSIKGWGAYCTSKAAIHRLTQCYQADIKDPLFACVMPGIVDTAMTQLIRQSSHEMEAQQYDFHKNLYEIGHLLSPNTVASFLRWLLLSTSNDDYVSREWDIYDKSHHHLWLQPPNQVYAL